MNKIKFDCNSHCAPAYSCSEPGDNSGWYVQADVAEEVCYAVELILNDLPSNRDWIDPAIERFARAAIAKVRGMVL